MQVLGLVVAVVLAALTVAAVMGRIDGALGEPTSTASYLPLPQDHVTADDIAALRLDTALRGYRMDQVDEVIGRLSTEIDGLRTRLQQADDATADPDPIAAQEVSRDETPDGHPA